MINHYCLLDASGIATNVEAMTSKGLRATCMSKYPKADASYNVELTNTTFIGYSLC